MNTKLTAVLMAAIMVATCAAVIVSADQAEAKNNDVIEVDPVNFTNSEGTLTLYMNKYEYDGYVNNVVWKFDMDADGSYNVMSDNSTSPSEVVNSGGNKVTAYYTVQEGYDGKYKFTFKNKIIQTENVADKTIGLKCELSVNVNGQNKVMNLFYNVPLNLSETNDGYDIPNDQTLPLNTKNATVMVPFNEKVYGGQDVDAISKYQGYNWYAVGLPDGLSMNMDGTITGVPTKATSNDGVQVKVVAVDKATNVQYAGTFYFFVSAGLVDDVTTGDDDKPLKYTYSVKVNEEGAVDGPSTVLVVQDDVVKMTITAINSDTKFGTVTVKVVKSDGSAENNLTADDPSIGNSRTYSIPTSGTGAYRVIMTAGTADTTTVYYDLIVISDIEDVKAGIIVQGA